MSAKKTKLKSSLTSNEIQHIRSTVDSFILPKGTFLYRTQPEKYNGEVISLYDNDTGKKGIYFSNSKHIPIGMILEYKKTLELCLYQTNKDLKLYNGKYAFRDLEPELFYKNFKKWEKGKNHSNSPRQKIYWNHYDNGAYPIDNIFSGENCDIWEKINIAEIFITDCDDIKFIKSEGLITMEYAKQYLEKELYKIKKENLPQEYKDIINLNKK